MTAAPPPRRPAPCRSAPRRLAPLLVTLAALAAALFGLLRGVGVSGDMAAFLPPARTEAGAFLLRELRGGAATTLFLVGIEGAPAPELARLSRALGGALRGSGRFAFVGNGAADLSDAETALLVRYRYLLSPEVTPALFETATLRAKLQALLDGLRSSASPLVARFGFADPVGAFADLARRWLAGGRVALREGVWFADAAPAGAPADAPAGNAAPGDRALLIARIAGSGLDAAAQGAALDLIRAAFAAAAPGPARLLVSGPAVFAAEAAAAIRADVQMISLLSTALLLAFLLWRYRSPLMLLAVAVPLGSGILAGILAVLLGFGSVHGAALGFGMTMLGVAVDYPILLVTQRRPEEDLAATARRLWPTLRLAAAAAVAGLTAMLFSGFPGLAQLGLFAVAGLPTGALVTRFALPRLLPGAAITARDLPAGWMRALLALPRWRGAALAVVAAAGIGLAASGGVAWERDLAALSPVPQAQRDLDAELRAQLGAPDLRHLIVVTAPGQAAALEAAERVGAALAPLVARGAIEGIDLPSRYLPSPRTQRARQAALPDRDTLRARLDEARAGLPFRPDAFDRFLDAVEESRALPPLTREALGAAAPLLAARLDPLLAPPRADGRGWQALVVPSGLRDAHALADALAALGEPGLLLVDVKAETQALVDGATRLALIRVGGGALLVLALLVAGLGGLRPALRTAAPLAGALLVTVAVLGLLGERLSLFHAVALLLLAGVGMDYALFLARSADEPLEERARALRSVLNCTLTTLLTFGLLALCGTPVLHGIGLTVAIGVVAAFLLAASLAAPAAPAAARSPGGSTAA